MRILIIRHGDPDYEKDSLTQKGWHEAELLADKMEKTDVTAFYVSPLGRAQDTASVTLKRLGRNAKTYHWLREFHAPIYDKKTKKRTYLRYDTSNDEMNIIAQGDYILCAVYEDKVYLSNAEGEKTEYSYIALYDFVKGDITGVKKYKSMWG